MIRKLIKEIPILYSAALKIKHSRWTRITNREFVKYTQENTSPKLQLGAGLNIIPGWFNTDYFARRTVFFLDATKKFCFPDNVFEWVFSEHQIEHISYLEGQFMLDEIFRVMKPGGYIKITTPDLHKYLLGYINNTLDNPVIKQHAQNWIYCGFSKAINYVPVNEKYEAHFVNDIFLNYDHRFIYDEQSLKDLLIKAGFNNVIVTGSKSKPGIQFPGIESHNSEFDQLFNLTVEAQKPLS